MKLYLISPEEKQLLKEIETKNGPEIFLWKLSNILIPIATILISIIAFSVFKDTKSANFMTYVNLILGGSIPMIALNRIGGMGFYLFNFDKSKEQAYGIVNTYHLRIKLYFSLLFVVLGTIFIYVYQVLNNPFDLTFKPLWVSLFSILAVYFSIVISKKIYLLQDKLINKTFDQELRDEIREKGHGNNW